MKQVTRVRRWIVPVTFLSLAVAAVVFLGVISLTDEVAGPRRAVRSKVAGGPRAKVEALAPRKAPAKAPPVTAGAVAGRPSKAQKAKSSGGAPLAVRLARTPTLEGRLVALDEAVAGLDDPSATAVLADLLEAPMPGTHYEAETLRLRALALIGRRTCPQAEACLIERTRPEVPRPERLMALEMLAARELVGEGHIQTIASLDHDRVVQAKARWALQCRGAIR